MGGGGQILKIIYVLTSCKRYYVDGSNIYLSQIILQVVYLLKDSRCVMKMVNHYTTKQITETL